jgi:hypothetical protein
VVVSAAHTLWDGFPVLEFLEGKMAMKIASLFVAGLAVAISSIAILSITPANAAQDKPQDKCSSTTWPMVSPVQCRKPRQTSYTACTDAVRKFGWEAVGAWYYCSNQGFKS